MGRHVWLRTPTKHDRADIFDLYINKVAHEPDLDTERKRDELARVTNGYSPAMIEQVCSMALTLAHSEGRERFDYEDIFEAMTTIESGTAINIEYGTRRDEGGRHSRGRARCREPRLHEGRGVDAASPSECAAPSLGHHQVAEQEERFSRWRSEQMAILIWGLGAMAAERVFYEQTSTGVGGDVAERDRARRLHGRRAAAMGPEPLDASGELDAKEEARILKRFEGIGSRS